MMQNTINSSTVLHRVTLLPGAWVGSETSSVMQEVIAATGVLIEWERFDATDHVPKPLLDSAKRTGRLVRGRLSGVRTHGQLPPAVQLRQSLGSWCMMREVRAIPGAPARFPNIDVVVIREASEGIYTGMEHAVAEGVYEAIKVTTATACERIARHAYAWARAHGRKKVSIVHKSNIMKKSDGLFLKTAQRVAQEYPDIQTEEVIVDALCMRLVRWPESFDVLLTGNLFGDIVSDLCSGLAGGLTASTTTTTCEGVTLFENPHGKAPTLVGRDLANPIPMVQTGVKLLRDLGETIAADRIEAAIIAAAQAGCRTTDQGGAARCSEVRDTLLAHLASQEVEA
ncbi:MAG: isocitrate dehydrogenase [Deltaproteobacteria bacterium]|nr:isocitrate dehydrogenase [Deltaproteobacteria bacterium]HCH61770.1 NAD-dependent isocitrate dehydrogenase [Deltaproteobacteria bacterium]